MSKIALITGITGQDGAYLTELLLSKGYIVHGIKRRSSSFNTERVDHLYKDFHDPNCDFFMHYGDLTDSTNIIRLIQKISPHEIYNLGAQSHVQVSFLEPEYTAETDAIGTLRVLEAIRILGLDKQIKFYQASTSELYGLVQEIPQKETTPFYPRSPYAVAKLYAYWITVNYREAYDMFACNGILFNHESPIRGETFVTRKITRAVARILLGLEEKLYLGNLDAKRDWGHAKDYVNGMWLILQQEKPEDFVLATGQSASVREFAEMAFNEIGVKLKWIGKGKDEKGIIDGFSDKASTYFKQIRQKGDVVIEVDKNYFRPAEVEFLLGDPSKAEKILKWQRQYDLQALVTEMVEADIKNAQRSMFLKEGGFREPIPRD